MGLFRKVVEVPVERPVVMATAIYDLYMLGQHIRQGEKLPADSPFVQLKPDSFIVTDSEMEKHRNGQ